MNNGGEKMGKMVTCARCHGKGTILAGGSLFTAKKEVKCPACNGSGKVNQD